MTGSQLRRALDQLLAAEQPHAERLAVAVGLISAAMEEHGLEVTVVGGSALELHAPGAYATRDIDLIVEGLARTRMAEVFRGFGFERRARHWVRADLFIEVVGDSVTDPVEAIDLGSLRIRVIAKEIALADRIIGFKWWRYTEYGAQAVELIRALQGQLDDRLLLSRLSAEHALDAYDALQRLAAASERVSAETLAQALEQLHRII